MIYSVYDEEFRSYGSILEGFDTSELSIEMMKIDLPENGTSYQPWIDSLEKCEIFNEFRNRAYGGMPIELGMCWGHNTKLNGLEYHRDSEVNFGTSDFILLLAKRDEIIDGKLDSSCVKAFRVPRGVVVEVFATTLHYAPCHVDEKEGFRCAVVLPRGTNTAKPEIECKSLEDRMFRARNKWLIVHEDAPAAKSGAYVGITGSNIDISKEL